MDFGSGDGRVVAAAAKHGLRSRKDNPNIYPITQRVHVPNIWVVGFWVIVIIEQVLGRYMIIRYLDP